MAAMRKAKNRAAHERGVYVAPWIGPNGETVLIAISRAGHLVGDPLTIPIGGNHVGSGDDMWDRLEADDPVPNLRVI
jgi:hypothetical protein